MRIAVIKKIANTLFLAGILAANSWGASATPQPEQDARLRVISKPADARISINGRQRGATPVTLTLPPGKYLISAEKSDYKPIRQTVILEADQVKTCELKLHPINGLVLIHSTPDGADVEIDGANRGTTPLFVSDLPLGHYRAKFIKPGYLAKEIEIKITKRTPIKVDVKLTSDSAKLTVNSEPQGATVTVNGINHGTTPCTIDRVPSGTATLELNLDGFVHYNQRLLLSAGETQDITATLKAIPSNLRIVSMPSGARIYINNQYKGKAPVTIKNIQAGNYRVRAEMEAHDPMARTVNVGRAKKLIVEEFRMRPNAGTVEITTEPAGVKVMINGKTIGTTSAKEDSTDRISQRLSVGLIPCGSQTLKLTKVGYFPESIEVNIERNQTYTHHFRLKRRFIPDYEIKTRSRVYRGLLISVDAQRNVKLEVAPGIFKTLKRNEIISATPLREDKVKESMKN